MHRLIIVSFAFLVILFVVSMVTFGFGYYAHRTQVEPAFGLAERIIVKGRRMLGMPTETVGMVDKIETIYLTLRGTTYLMPDNDFSTGGALALWGDDVIVLNRSGTIYRLEKGSGLEKVNVVVPENGLAAYIQLAAETYPDQFTRDAAIRYNDIEFIDSAAFRGFLLSYTYIDTDDACYRNRISKLPVGADVGSIRDLQASADDWELVYDSTPCLTFNPSRELIVGYMAGGRIAFKEPNLLYLGNGEYHREGIYRPDSGIQDDDSDYGKTIEINLTTGRARHFSKGHRNLQGVALDNQGQLWTTEHGMRGGDELNLIRDGENYGWPLENLGTLYSGVPAPTIGRPGRHEVFEAPVYAWLPSVAVSSIALVDGFHETWDGDLLVGSLRGRTLFRVRIQGDRVVFLESIPIGQRIRDVMQVGPDLIALWLDTNELVIFEIENRVDRLDGLIAGLVEQNMTIALAEQAHEILVGCNECHSYEENVHGAGPSLHNIAGRRIASTAFANYSEALSRQSGMWDHEALTAFLVNPDGFAEGTLMSGMGLSNADVADAVASALEWMSLRATDSPER